MIPLIGAALAGPYVAPEVSLQLLKQGARVPDKVTCVQLICDQERVTPLTWGGSLLLDQNLFVQARHTHFLNHRLDARPWALDIRAGAWVDLGDRAPDALRIPTSELHVFAGVRQVHHTGDGDLLLDGTAVQVGLLAHYRLDSLPEEMSAYGELTYLRYVRAPWNRHDDRGRGGFVFRTGANLHLVQFGANVTADPGFGFSAMLELGLRLGVNLGS